MKNLLFCILASILVFSCATFKKNTIVHQSSPTKNLSGTYLNISDDKTNTSLLSLLDRKMLSDTLHSYPKFDSVKIILKDDKNIALLFMNNTQKINRNYGYSSKVDSKIYLKNKNLQPILIPYILGGIDHTKLRLYVDIKGDLIVDVANFRSGAIGIAGWLTWKHSNKTFLFKNTKTKSINEILVSK